MSPLWKTAKDKIFSVPSVLFILLITVFYICLSAWLLNYQLLSQTLFAQFPTWFKFNLLYQLAIGIFSAQSMIGNLFLVLNGIFVGLNVLLLIKTISTLEGLGKVKLSIGGATIIALITAGCGACGLTFFSLVGLSTSLSFLPFHGIELQAISLAILIFSSWYMIRKLTQAHICTLM